MISAYIRSSSYTCYKICQHKFFIEYVLGIKQTSGFAADRGNCTHKALELLARWKLATQNKESILSDDELGIFSVEDITSESAIAIAWKYITEKSPHHKWSDKEFKECKAWMYEVLNFRDGMFSPLKREVVKPEQYFDLEIKEPWAIYDYVLPNGEKMTGYLKIKGTMDLMVRHGKDLEMIDWKTGGRIDWSNFQYKTYEKLMDDFQLRLYHYAATRLYPDIENIFVSIFYTRTGPESMYFGPQDVKKTKEMIRKHFESVRNNFKPRIVYPSRKCSFCEFAKKDEQGRLVTNYEDSICNKTHQDVIHLGLDKVMLKYGKENAFNNYGSGGGRSNREEKKNESTIQETSTNSENSNTGNTQE